MIYLDNAATSLHKPESVAKAVYEAILTMGNSSRGAHAASLASMRTVFAARELINEMFHGDDACQVAFTSNSTESLNIAIRGTFEKGDHVITTSLEHNSVLRPLYYMEKQGVELTILKADKQGNISYEEMERAIRPNTKGIVCTHASNLIGNMLDLERIGKICKSHGLLFIVDASQTAGMFPIDMQKMNISILCFTGHKSLLGPQGTGGLCVRKNVAVRPFKVGGSGILSYEKEQPKAMPTVLEAGTLNAHGIAGLYTALTYLKEQDVDALRDKELALMRRFYEGVRNIPLVKVYGDFSAEMRAPIVTINIGDYDSGQVSDELMERFCIATRAGAHCAPLMHECLGTKEQGAVRFSFSHFNTEAEVDSAIEAVRILATEE